MNIKDYKNKIKEIGFEEYPMIIFGRGATLKSFINYDSTTLGLKIYLTKLTFCRNFYSSSGILFCDDVDWLIANFLRVYKNDLLKPWLTPAIKEAMEMIISKDAFGKGVVATTFMFTVVEFYAKYKLDFRPHQYDFFDDKNQSKFRNLFISDAINKLKRANMPVAKSLNEIDKRNVKRLKDAMINEGRWVRARIADKLKLTRNAMLHGENHSFYDVGRYLVMLYILFYLHDS